MLYTLTKERNARGLVCSYVVTFDHTRRRFHVGADHALSARAEALRWAKEETRKVTTTRAILALPCAHDTNALYAQCAQRSISPWIVKGTLLSLISSGALSLEECEKLRFFCRVLDMRSFSQELSHLVRHAKSPHVKECAYSALFYTLTGSCDQRER